MLMIYLITINVTKSNTIINCNITKFNSLIETVN